MRAITKKNYTIPGEMEEAIDKSRPGKAANLEEESSFQHRRLPGFSGRQASKKTGHNG